MDYIFVDSILELINSTNEFFSKPEFWKATIGNAPRYFVHIQNSNRHYFGLSKFCAFQSITVEEYISTYRYKANGGNTQKHISKLTGKNWIPRNKVDNSIRFEFDMWITKFHPNYNLNNASFITISDSSLRDRKRKKFVNPDILEDNLKLQREIGEIGEQIALEYELERLLADGITKPEKYVEHTSKINSAAGFDISSLIVKKNRFIEVKSSLNEKLDFYITENEYRTLEELADNAYIYFVYISNLSLKKGKVIKELRNPISELNKNGNLKPVVYKAKIN